MALGGGLLVACSTSDAGNQETSDAGNLDVSDAGNQENCVAPVSGPCDPMSQCGCDAAQQCDITYLSGESKCIDVGDRPVGSSCDWGFGYGQCVPGATCVDGVCRKHCKEESDCPADARCVQIGYFDNEDTFIDIPQKKACYENCRPWDETSCGNWLNCRRISDYGEKPGWFTCNSGGTSTLTCSMQADCAPGWSCIGDGVGGGQCRRWCRIGNSDCNDEQFCARFGSGGVYSDTTEVGFCTAQCEPWVETSCETSQQCRHQGNWGDKPGAFDCWPGGTSTTSCSVSSDCAPGWLCMVWDQCRKYCRVGGSDCADGQFCGPFGGGGGYWGTTEVGFCTAHCQPWVETSCNSGMTCQSSSDYGEKPGTFDCMPGGNGPIFCSKEADCPPGFGHCSGGMCYQWCRIGDSDCPAGKSCLEVGTTGKQGLYWESTEVGHCR